MKVAIAPIAILLSFTVILILHSCIEPIDPPPPPIAVGANLEGIAEYRRINGCEVNLFSDTRTSIVRILLPDGSFWEDSNGNASQVFRQNGSGGPLPLSFEVPDYGSFMITFEYRLICNECMCGNHYTGPILVEKYPWEARRIIYNIGEIGLQFDGCDDCL